MLRNREKKKFPARLFVVVSLAVFAVFFLLFSVFLASLRYDQNDGVKKPLGAPASKDDKLFLNEDYKHNDPYTTKIPDLKDMLRGPIITDDDPSLGKKDAPVTLVLFSDFECAVCHEQEKVLKEVLDKYDLRLVWKDYPTNDPESRAYQAALAARCASDENAFWEYHDLLYSGKFDLSQEGFLAAAKELSLDEDDFETCLSQKQKAPLVNDNMVEAESLGIEGVPFLYVNDQEALGGLAKEDLEKVIKIELERNTRL